MKKTKQQLEKIDLLRERTGVGYKEAQEALKESKGDVIDAVVIIEEKKQRQKKEFHVAGNKVVKKVKELIKQGNVTKIQIKKGKEVLVNIPATVGVLGTVIYPPLAVLGMAVTIAGKYTLEVEYEGK
ncbi:DUF4342 domain-containing protein [Selenihalanaerobacter shriftii]|uniref:DUF4342 domain-containing protein n=1 Tax=Selenihalanaerobacter shriftii TaxID=142842 RepID=A0A1T4MWY5_9FIRM|nr:DUF4342 domain-containing protein [Selenihalanaerobacter shriftii]SJZ71473.1 protein of unknown function [Selenihalanaerobacter shriftii]